jgi:ribonuclease E
LADSAPIIAETPSVQAEEDETFEVRSEENVQGGSPSDRRSALQEESEIGRRRRRRRRRRVERPFGDSLSGDVPQPTDDGLAVVAQFGGDLVVSAGDDDAFNQRGLRSGEERHRRSRGSRSGRNRFRQADGEATPEMSAPGFDSAPSLVLEEEFAGSEADYSTPPSSGRAVSHEEATTVPSPVAEAKEHEIEGQMIRGAAVEGTAASFATAEADSAPDAAAGAPSATEQPRPRRSGWWQRARASVIGK